VETIKGKEENEKKKIAPTFLPPKSTRERQGE